MFLQLQHQVERKGKKRKCEAGIFAFYCSFIAIATSENKATVKCEAGIIAFISVQFFSHPLQQVNNYYSIFTVILFFSRLLFHDVTL